MSDQKTIIRYSTAFKQKVISEIESGKFSVEKARKIYDIGASSTIHSWIKKFGKNHLIAKVVRVEMRNEHDKLKQLEQKIQQLESALAQSHLKTICLESLLECVEAHYQIDVKKNFGSQVQQELMTKSRASR